MYFWLFDSWFSAFNLIRFSVSYTWCILDSLSFWFDELLASSFLAIVWIIVGFLNSTFAGEDGTFLPSPAASKTLTISGIRLVFTFWVCDSLNYCIWSLKALNFWILDPRSLVGTVPDDKIAELIVQHGLPELRGSDCAVSREANRPGVQSRTGGVLVLVQPDGHIAMMTEIIETESVNCRIEALLDFSQSYFAEWSLFDTLQQKTTSLTIIHDDACSILSAIQARARSASPESHLAWLAKQRFIVDRFHYNNHQGLFCALYTSPYTKSNGNHDVIEDLNDAAAEQVFSDFHDVKISGMRQTMLWYKFFSSIFKTKSRYGDNFFLWKGYSQGSFLWMLGDYWEYRNNILRSGLVISTRKRRKNQLCTKEYKKISPFISRARWYYSNLICSHMKHSYLDFWYSLIQFLANFCLSRSGTRRKMHHNFHSVIWHESYKSSSKRGSHEKNWTLDISKKECQRSYP